MTDLSHRTFSHLSAESRARGETNDCVVKAVAVVTGWSYDDAHAACARYGRKPRRGMFPSDYHRLLRDHGFRVVRVDRMNDVARENGFVPVTSKTNRTVERELARNYGGCRVLISNRSHVLSWDGSKVVDWSAGRLKRVIGVYLVYPAGRVPTVGRKTAATTVRPSAHVGQYGTVSQMFREYIVAGGDKATTLAAVRATFTDRNIPDSYYAWYVRDCRKKNLIK